MSFVFLLADTLTEYESPIVMELPPLIETLKEKHKLAKENTEYLSTIVEYLTVNIDSVPPCVCLFLLFIVCQCLCCLWCCGRFDLCSHTKSHNRRSKLSFQTVVSSLPYEKRYYTNGIEMQTRQRDTSTKDNRANQNRKITMLMMTRRRQDEMIRVDCNCRKSRIIQISITSHPSYPT